MDSTAALPPPELLREKARSVIAHKSRQLTEEQQRVLLLRKLEVVEESLLHLHSCLHETAGRLDETEVRALIEQLREDERDLQQSCLHQCDHEDPEISLDHDRLNNDATLSLNERLAVASRFFCKRRIVFLHHLQREICRKLLELGISVSRN